MEITKQETGAGLDVVVDGRLDAYWADHLAAALDEAVRGGAHHIRLDMASVSFMSSVGIRVLLRFFKQLQRINGSFVVSHPSKAVQAILELAGLEMLLAAAAAPTEPQPGRKAEARRLERPGIVLEIYDLAADATVTCRVLGQPDRLARCGFVATHCRSRKFPESTFGIGLGAFGSGFADCQARFGEFLAVAGAAAYLPTDGSNVPDHILSAAAYVPEVQVLYGLACDGGFAHLVRFESGGDGAVPLAQLAAACLESAGTAAAGIVVVAESAGLVGAALRRSPAVGAVESTLFAHPQVRAWLSFTPERAYARSLALAVGVVVRGEKPELAGLLRPLGPPGDGLAGHFHAAAFSYRPLQKGQIDLRATVATLFEAETLQGVLHLLTDDRQINGVGQSELVRGACWVAPIAAITTDAV